ncbi:MAG: C39 family peptidase [Clostridia bacterium]|nr:C39 family peptidase [Clostridia bacterium]
MKKFISFLITLTLILSLYPVSLFGAKAPSNEVTTVTGFVTPSTVDSRNETGKYLILNKDGSYGGSYNDALYGKGAPLNGEYDVVNSDYYYHGDYYNMKSNYTENSSGVRSYQRYIYPNFSPYQQTMQDTSGIACIVMILNYLGYDVSNYSELYLLNEYERINETTVYGNGTTPEGLVNLVNSLGLTGVTANSTEIDTSSFVLTDGNDYEAIRNIFRQCLLDGKFLVMRYQSPNGFGYKVLLGHDNKGTLFYSYSPKTALEFVGDDYMIFAEPNDNYDHFQDGYTANRFNTVIRWWFNMTANGTISNEHEYFIIDPSIDVDFETDAEKIDKTNHLQEAYDIHLPLNGEEMWNVDGVVNEYKKYGSTRNGKNYGFITSGGGLTNRPDLPYCKIKDYYQMGSEGSRILLPNYTILQQTMSSSCGVCSVNSVLKYYGYYEDTSYYDLELLYTNAYDNHPGFNDVVRGGTSNGYHKITLESLGYTSHYYSTPFGGEPVFENYKAFVSFVKYNLLNDRPMVTVISPSGAHFVTIIGYDDMGTSHIYDDVLVIADSSDYWDGYQDGYNIYSATQYYYQFTNGSNSNLYPVLVIYKN